MGVNESHGLTLYRSPETGRLYLFTSNNNGLVEQSELFDDGTGRIDAATVRQFAVESHALLRVAVVALIGFLIHSFLPMAFRLRFFVLLSLAGIYAVLGAGYFFQSTGIHMLLLVISAIACYAMSLAPVTWVVLSEIFPNRIRGAAMAVATVSLWLASFLLIHQHYPEAVHLI